VSTPYRRRLRPAYSPVELAKVYATPHQHTQWRDHRLRVDVTVQVALWFDEDVRSVADLSCGDAAIANRVAKATGARTTLGVFAPGYRICGPIEDTIHRIGPVDLFICSETLEHLDQPEPVLAAIRGKTRYLVLSTPDGEDDDGNPEHYWGWDTAAVEAMLRGAGFTPELCNVLKLSDYDYDYQIWGCR
jgi:hypothetical protein